MAAPVLLGPDGMPIDRTRLLVEQAAPSLTSVRNIVSDHPADGLTPQRLARILREAEATDARAYLELAELMEERDLHYLGVLGKRKRGVAQLAMTVEPASNSADDKIAAELVRTFVNRLELQDEVLDLLDALGKGFSVTEILWDLSEKQWMPQKLKHRDPRWFRFSLADGETLELWDNAGYIPLAPYQFVQHVAKAKSGLPIRGGLARAAAWSYLFKNLDLKSWVIFAETYGQPIRVGKYGPGASDDDKRALLTALRNISQDCAAMIPASMEIEFIEAKMTGSIELYEKLANFLDQQVSKAVLGQTGTTDAIAGGHAVGKVHQQGQDDIQRSDAKQLEVSLNRDLVKPIVDLNMGPRAKGYPILRIVIEDKAEALPLAQALAVMVDRGLKVAQTDVRRKLGFDEPSPGDDLLTPAKTNTPAPPSPGGSDASISANAAGATEAPIGGATVQNDAIDDLVAEQLADWRKLTAPMVQPILDLAVQCRSFDEFLAQLPGIIPKQNGAALTEALARSLFAGTLAGETGAETHDHA